MKELSQGIRELQESLNGEIGTGEIIRTIYSTDASVYREMPVAVAWPSDEEDIRKIVRFAQMTRIPLTMRGAGTSLAGQVVSRGIIVDISRYMNRILEINPDERWVRVQPGVVLEELNMELKKYGLFFGPETSTANRCNIGGMVGNNACGLHSLVYGSTRDHTISVRAILSDGSNAEFGPVDAAEFSLKCNQTSLEGRIYRNIRDILSDPLNAESIRNEYPDSGVHRRNTGYALDILLDTEIFTPGSERKFNLSNLITGSEGTLAIITEVRLALIPLPPAGKALVCVHLAERNDAFRANLVALRHRPSAVEMMDDRILELTKNNISQRRNRFFVEGDPGALLIVEFVRDSVEKLDRDIASMIEDLKKNRFGYAFPVLKGKDISRAWDLRKAGLGVLSNMKGDAKPVTLIEDTAINVNVLPEYMEELERMLASYGKDSVYHAHIGTGELHIRPVLNLKDPSDVELFRTIGQKTALIVKKYRGSISGEHGDGRLRGEFIPLVIGERNYGLLKEVKRCWDPHNILNPGKITDTPPMNTSLRYEPGKITADISTLYDFSSTDGILRAAENCNGSGDCRKSEIIGGVMCPSYMATRDERNTTRARANILREFLGRPGSSPWNHPEILEILDLCLSCKGCKSECPSNVDMAKLKSEFMQHWYDIHGVPLRTRLVAWFPMINRIGSVSPALYNFLFSNKIISGTVKSLTGFAKNRSIPLIYRYTLKSWIRNNSQYLRPPDPKGRVCLFIDEFTNYNDTETGINAVRLLYSLGYEIIIADHDISGRTFISKGLLRDARTRVQRNIRLLSATISEDLPLVGMEPSALLGFRDEYPDLAGPELKESARQLSQHSLLFDEFIAREFTAGRIRREQFTGEVREILMHGHCQQKAVASTSSLTEALSIPANYQVREIKSGCCGMAGSFGYEKEHFELSNKIGEMVLFPEIRNAPADTLIVAPGTSCRHHIKDGTGRNALHPADVLFEALRK